MQHIIFGGGCFWCVEAVFKRLRGVASVRSGYAGGTEKNPHYYSVASGTTGYAEVIEVVYDPAVIRLEDLLAVFFSSHDPTTRNRQGADVGPQYRSAIFYTDESQRTVIDAFIQKLESEHTFENKIVTEVRPLETFYEAESSHQDYYDRNREQPYCQVVIDPKIVKLRKQFAHLLTDETES